MPAPRREIPDLDQHIQRYVAGTSATQLAREIGVSDWLFRQRLRERGIAIRSPQQYPAHTDAAHEARRGQRDSEATKIARAETRKMRGLGTSAHEDRFAELLDQRHVRYERQTVVRYYNVDFTIDEAAIAVEIVGGGYTPRRRAARQQRLDDLLNRGWHVLDVRVLGHPELLAGAADYVVALMDITGRDPSAAREYRVVRADGQPITSRTPKTPHRA